MWRLVVVGCLATGCRDNFDDRADAPSSDVVTIDSAATSQLDVTVDGLGQVTSQPPGIACPPTCSASFPADTTVRLSVTPQLTQRFLGWDTRDCYVGATCDVPVGATPASVIARFTGLYNVAFVLATPPLVPFTLSQVDAACSQHATSVGLPGTYLSWLSLNNGSAASRIGAASGWVATDGFTFASTVANLLTGKIAYPLRLDENQQPTTQLVFTGTNGDGTFSFNNCVDWTDAGATATVGVGDAPDSTFTNLASNACASSLSFYCFGTDYQTLVPVPPGAGRLAFLSTPWTPGGGIASADLRCQTDAGLAGLPGTFRAFLATSTGAAVDRAVLAGAPWIRRDQRRLIPSAAMLTSAQGLLAPLNQLANGTVSTDTVAFTGTALQNCNDWTDSSATNVPIGSIQYAVRTWSYVIGQCGNTFPIYCFQD